MNKTVTATEAKNRFGTVLGWVVEGDEVVVERQGRPQAVILSFAQYQKIQELREHQRRLEALEQLRRLRDEISERNRDLTPEQIEEIADSVSRRAVERLVDKGAVRFEDRPGNR